ncbi:hypothetical protein F2Q69_00028057 [Brassica cretica]|uniref:Uncharacterized protein n=1 Tax=Brassica cretica TaxID=69181 RepID=A0A8S9RWG9_BRACR|nr:hypothetical protein F2Q69_00028057 [Brassica cretica]
METRATSLRCSGKVAPGYVSQRLHVVAPGSRSRQSLQAVAPGSALPKITLITSLELQMYPNVSRNSMWYSNT